MLFNNKNTIIHLGITDYAVVVPPVSIACIGLGSCIGLFLWDRVKKIAGGVHIMLPYSQEAVRVTKPTKFCDTAVPFLLEEMLKKGALRSQIVAKIAGGAQLLGKTNTDLYKIGYNNVKSIKETLEKHKIKLVAEDTGKKYGRTALFDSVTGKLEIQILQTQKVIII